MKTRIVKASDFVRGKLFDEFSTTSKLAAVIHQLLIGREVDIDLPEDDVERHGDRVVLWFNERSQKFTISVIEGDQSMSRIRKEDIYQS